MASSEGEIESVDKANMQKIVNVFTQRVQKFDREEELLQKNLEDFTEFVSIETPENDEDKKPILIPIPFKREKIKDFKKLTSPISLAMWACPKVVVHMRKELFPFEYGQQPQTPSQPQIYQPEQIPIPKENLLEKIKTKINMQLKHANSPYNATQNMILDFEAIPRNWRLMLHWYHLGIKKTPEINTRDELQRRIDNIAITFDFDIEPFLLMAIRYAHEIILGETEHILVNVLQAHLQIRERHRMELQTIPQPF